MIPKPGSSSNPLVRIPRESGDDPDLEAADQSVIEYSPRERG